MLFKVLPSPRLEIVGEAREHAPDRAALVENLLGNQSSRHTVLGADVESVLATEDERQQVRLLVRREGVQRSAAVRL